MRQPYRRARVDSRSSGRKRTVLAAVVGAVYGGDAEVDVTAVRAHSASPTPRV
ncbi:hypothetical protein [Streptomyces sp. NBC_01262]|uniref:hypothetical protein n=1 Tax=Streptomyces sp. NBC_01262 TaxID=2903803 RepID=UPI002E349936|nr:hypothetical protein [Streptomyces sp. NBC_01262]